MTTALLRTVSAIAKVGVIVRCRSGCPSWESPIIRTTFATLTILHIAAVSSLRTTVA
jgi:hypothetical protein